MGWAGSGEWKVMILTTNGMVLVGLDIVDRNTHRYYIVLLICVYINTLKVTSR